MSGRLRRHLRRVVPWWRRFKRNGYRVDRCAHCGHRFRWSRDARHATGNRDGRVFHGPCLALRTWRAKAEERLAVLALAMELAGLTPRDVKDAVELRAVVPGAEPVALDGGRAFRVFYDLEKVTEEETR